MQGARTGSHNYSILQGKRKRCYFTDTETGPLERHHIYFGVGMRQISDKHGFWCGSSRNGTEERRVSTDGTVIRLICG